MTGIAALRERVAGRVITPDDDGYDEARRVYNAMIDKRPRAVVRCAGVDDVTAVVDFAREQGQALAVRGGGHSVPGFGTCDDGIVADLSGMRRVAVDAVSRTAVVQGGATWGDVDRATHAAGLATTGGIISTTGVGGLALGGGIGHLARWLGLTCDNLRSAEVVTADGRHLSAGPKEHEDLFWALRGGGGNFGVVTSFEFALAPLDTVYGGLLFFDLAHADDLLRFYREFVTDAPERLGVFPAFQIGPPLPFLPEERRGQAMIAFVVCWTGEPATGERVVQRIREVAPVVGEHVGPLPYPQLNSTFDGLLPPGLQHYWKAGFVSELTDEAIGEYIEHGARLPAVNSTVHIYPINGACHRVAPGDTAFAYRDATFAAVIVGVWPDPADTERNIAWVRDYYAAVAPYAEEGGYVNFMAGDDQDRVRANYRGNYDRLVAVKRAYDPDNLFHLNQNIRP